MEFGLKEDPTPAPLPLREMGEAGNGRVGHQSPSLLLVLFPSTGGLGSLDASALRSSSLLLVFFPSPEGGGAQGGVTPGENLPLS